LNDYQGHQVSGSIEERAVIDDRVAMVARAAAEQLSPQMGSRLAVDVEMVLAGGDYNDPTSERYFDLVSFGGLLVSIAQLALQILDRHRAQGQTPTLPVLAREIRITQREITHVDGTVEKLTEVVASEAIKAIENQ
jgi:hypothetical protein